MQFLGSSRESARKTFLGEFGEDTQGSQLNVDLSGFKEEARTLDEALRRDPTNGEITRHHLEFYRRLEAVLLS